MIMLIALSFWLCWTPFYAVTTITQLQTHSFLHESQFLFTMLTTHWAGFLNSCLNPLIYAALSNNFRRGFKQVSVWLLINGKLLTVTHTHHTLPTSGVTHVRSSALCDLSGGSYKQHSLLYLYKSLFTELVVAKKRKHTYIHCEP